MKFLPLLTCLLCTILQGSAQLDATDLSHQFGVNFLMTTKTTQSFSGSNYTWHYPLNGIVYKYKFTKHAFRAGFNHTEAVVSEQLPSTWTSIYFAERNESLKLFAGAEYNIYSAGPLTFYAAIDLAASVWWLDGESGGGFWHEHKTFEGTMHSLGVMPAAGIELLLFNRMSVSMETGSNLAYTSRHIVITETSPTSSSNTVQEKEFVFDYIPITAMAVALKF